MDNKKSWKLFESSGSVEDYINFKKDEDGKKCTDKEDIISANNNNGPCSESNKNGRE